VSYLIGFFVDSFRKIEANINSNSLASFQNVSRIGGTIAFSSRDHP
jgi:hypothetical protein